MAIEQPHPGIDYKQIGEIYGYRPFPDGHVPPPKINLGIDWSASAQARMAQQAANFKSACDNPVLQDSTKPFDSQNLPSTDGNIPLRSYLWKHPKYQDFCLMVNLDTSPLGRASSYMVSKEGNSWEVHDRIVSEAYREQGIGTQMTKTIENYIQAFADKTEEDQEITLEASQLTVLNIFLKNGYEVVDEQKTDFEEFKEKLEAGDPSYVIASCPQDFQEGVKSKKTWYVFKKETLDKLGDTIWEYNDTEKKENYMIHSVRFKLHKKIKAKSDKITTLVGDTRDALRF